MENYDQDYWQNELFYAVENYDADDVQNVLDHGADANIKSPDDDYALYAALKQNTNRGNKIASVLIDAMTTESIQDFDSHPLRITENIGLIDKLLDKGAKLNESDCLIWASNPETLQHLIDKGADVNQYLTNKKGGFLSNVRGGNLENVKVFVENGVNITEAHAVEWALSGGKREIADYLLEQTKGQVSNINECAIYSAGNEYLDLLEKFHKQGADINTENNDILETASRRNNAAIARYVLENTNVSADDQEKSLKAGIDNYEIVALFLVERKYKPTADTKAWIDENAKGHIKDLVAKADLFERLNQKPQKATQATTKDKSQTFKHKI